MIIACLSIFLILSIWSFVGFIVICLQSWVGKDPSEFCKLIKYGPFVLAIEITNIRRRKQRGKLI